MSFSKNKRENQNWRQSLVYYLLSDLGMDLEQNISIPRIFFRTANRFRFKTALLEPHKGHYEPVTYDELRSKIEAFAAVTIQLGLPSQGRVALLLKNSPAWVISDLGTQVAGGIVVPIFGTLAPSVMHYILKHSEARILVVEDADQLGKILPAWPDLPELKSIVVRNTEGVKLTDTVISFEDLLKRGEQLLTTAEKKEFSRVDQLRRDHVASIIYTSGTTGDPKGVMLTHKNILSNVYGIIDVTDITSDDCALSVLPLSHVFERTVGYYAPLLVGCTIGYAESPEQISKNLLEIRPTVCCSVPRIFEKLHAKITQSLEQNSGIKSRLFNWALKVGGEVENWRRKKREVNRHEKRFHHRPEDLLEKYPSLIKNPWLFLKYQAAWLLVYRKVHQKLGGRLRYFISGGAALSAHIVDFFKNLQVDIFEGYGMTETSPIISFNYRHAFMPGTVGRIFPYVQVRLSEEGEILVKGPNVMAGYFKNPEATQQTINGDGWLHTGDVGEWVEKNFLKITDRIKELIVLSTGKNVAPLPIESKLRKFSLVDSAVVIGNDRKYISALVFPNIPVVKERAKALGMTNANLSALCQNEEIKKLYDEIIEQINPELSHYEQVKKFQLVPYDLTADPEKILTPTLKIKRRVVNQKFKEFIEQMY